MISAEDFIRLAYTPDLSESGISFAKHSLSLINERGGESVFAHLRQSVGNVAVELAFRRSLSAKAVPFDIKGAMPFSEPDHFDVLLGGRRCCMHTFLTTRRSQITEIRRNPNMLLEAPALITDEQLSGSQSSKDLQIFAFLFGLTTNSPEDILKATSANQPIYLIHPLPAGWATPHIWAPLGRLGFKSEGSIALDVEIGGLDIERNFITEKLALQHLKRQFAVNDYYSLAYIHADHFPNARVGIQSPGKDEILMIQTHEWDNIWVYGMEIWLTGYMTQDEFRRKASTTFSGSRVFQYSKTQRKNLSVSISNLHPLKELFEQVKTWQLEKKNW